MHPTSPLLFTNRLDKRIRRFSVGTNLFVRISACCRQFAHCRFNSQPLFPYLQSRPLLQVKLRGFAQGELDFRLQLRRGHLLRLPRLFAGPVLQAPQLQCA